MAEVIQFRKSQKWKAVVDICGLKVALAEFFLFLQECCFISGVALVWAASVKLILYLSFLVVFMPECSSSCLIRWLDGWMRLIIIHKARQRSPLSGLQYYDIIVWYKTVWLGRTSCGHDGQCQSTSLPHDQVWKEVAHVPRKCGLNYFNPGILIIFTFQKRFTAVRFSLQLGQQSDEWSSKQERSVPTHSPPPSLSFPFTPSVNSPTCTHTFTQTHTGQSKILRATGEICEPWASAEPLSSAVAINQKALATWKNSCNLQEEAGHLRDDAWVLSVLLWSSKREWLLQVDFSQPYRDPCHLKITTIIDIS